MTSGGEETLLRLAVFALGMLVGWLGRHPWHPLTARPLVEAGQAVTVIFEQAGVETAHRRVEAADLADTLLHPRLNPTARYRFDRVDERGRHIYVYEKEL